MRQLMALRWLLLVLLFACQIEANAVGLGQLQAKSWLGHPLLMTLPLVGSDSVSASCVTAKILSTDGDLIATARVSLAREKQSTSIVIQTDQSIREPAIAVSVLISCDTPVQRTYQILLDPQASPTEASESRSTSPIIAARALPSTRGSNPGNPPDSPSGARSRKNHNPASTAHNTTIGNDKKASTGKAEPTTPPPTGQSVLKLSNDTNPNADATSIDRLKLAWTLSAPGTESSSQATEAVRDAQSRFAALLRDEDPLKDATAKARTASEQRQILQAEVEVLREQSQLNAAKLEEAQNKNSYPAGWLIGLLALLLTSLISVAWLAWRLRSSRSGEHKWWENTPSNDSNANASDEPSVMEPSQESRSTSKLIPLRSSRKNSRPGKPRPETEFQEKRLEPRPAANSMPPAAEKTTAKISGFPQLGLPGDANPDTLPPQLQRPDMIKVEEISDTLQEVEFWMLLNDRSRALEILEPLGKVEKPDSPAPWLYLLDTYADMGDQAKYEALRERCERIFNVRIAKWEDKDIVVSSRGLEEFPHLMEQICKRWKGNQVVKFLENLLVDDRDGARAGFELPAYRDLMLLISLAKDIEPPKPVPESAAA